MTEIEEKIVHAVDEGEPIPNELCAGVFRLLSGEVVVVKTAVPVKHTVNKIQYDPEDGWGGRGRKPSPNYLKPPVDDGTYAQKFKREHPNSFKVGKRDDKKYSGL